MQFFYIDYMNDGKKERNIGFLRVENDGVSVGLRGVPAQCGDSCTVYAVDGQGGRRPLGEVALKRGCGAGKLKWGDEIGFAQCMRIEIPMYGTRRGECVLRNELPRPQCVDKADAHISENIEVAKTKKHASVSIDMPKADSVSGSVRMPEDLPVEVAPDKWQQLLKMYPQVHIIPTAQSIVIRPKDAIILAEGYHELASNSFVLHAYYNYRQLLLFRYGKGGTRYYLGVPGVYYEREQKVALMFGFEGFENGEARMQPDADSKLYRGCFGYYMKRVEI